MKEACIEMMQRLDVGVYRYQINRCRVEEVWRLVRYEVPHPSNMHRMCYGVYFSKKSPSLKPPGWGSILAHPCFERSLGFVLANRLKDTTLLATQLMDVFDDVFMKDVSIRQAVRLDVQAVKDRDPSCRSYSSALLYLKGYHALQSYRVANALWNRGQKVLALALQSRISEVLTFNVL
ncbi:hypothetical protein KP509_1Z304300 [Ceratopteris richardii]|nr:hypothetical protein KP509_1Z304300 [Ceratopteris richardii]